MCSRRFWEFGLGWY